jgi:hypothetical protein
VSNADDCNRREQVRLSAEAFCLGPLVPYHFDFDSTNKIIKGRFEGRVTDEDLKSYYRDAAEWAKVIGSAAGLTDLSGATSFEITRETVVQLANMEPALAGAKVVRVVIAPSPVAFGMARMFELTGERTRPNFHVVHTEQEALAILGVWNPRFKQLKEKPS